MSHPHETASYHQFSEGTQSSGSSELETKAFCDSKEGSRIKSYFMKKGKTPNFVLSWPERNNDWIYTVCLSLDAYSFYVHKGSKISI